MLVVSISLIININNKVGVVRFIIEIKLVNWFDDVKYIGCSIGDSIFNKIIVIKGFK